MYGTHRISCAVLDQGDPAAAAARGRLWFPDVVYNMVVDLNPAFTHVPSGATSWDEAFGCFVTSQSSNSCSSSPWQQGWHLAMEMGFWGVGAQCKEQCDTGPPVLMAHRGLKAPPVHLLSQMSRKLNCKGLQRLLSRFSFYLLPDLCQQRWQWLWNLNLGIQACVVPPNFLLWLKRTFFLQWAQTWHFQEADSWCHDGEDDWLRISQCQSWFRGLECWATTKQGKNASILARLYLMRKIFIPELSF